MMMHTGIVGCFDGQAGHKRRQRAVLPPKEFKIREIGVYQAYEQFRQHLVRNRVFKISVLIPKMKSTCQK